MSNQIVTILKKWYHLLPTPPSTNYTYRKLKHSPYDFLPTGGTIFDIGSKDERGVYSFGKPPEGSKVICVDIADGPGVDLVADAHDLNMVEDNSIDCVITISTVEHVRYPQKVVKEIHRILKPGGIIYLSVPFVFPFHSDPFDFYRFSSDGVEILCEDFECIESGFNRGPASTMCHLLVHFLAILFSFNSKTVYGINTDIFKWLLFWVKYLDYFIGNFNNAKVIHAAAFFLGKKVA